MSLYKLSAFPKTEFGGNKAGVFVNADHLSEQEMQKIAREVGFSETAFVLKSEIADFKVRFFTPTNEVDLCGHATIATFNLLRDQGMVDVGIYSQETKAGILNLRIEKDLVYMQQPAPKFDREIDYKELKHCFKNHHIWDERFPIQIVSTGMREIFFPIKDIETLNQLKPNFEEIIEMSIEYNVIGIHAFAIDETVDAYGRNFAPIVGIKEESATGTSSGALSCYLFKYNQKKESYILRQGYTMNLPSEIYTELVIENGKIQDVWVGGTATII